ncbi:MAG: hypothetical protein M3453_05685, partial [Pseudomonadota bacterium]|nr:hypothetical protein [Pseudomonadota bacterium]
MDSREVIVSRRSPQDFESLIAVSAEPKIAKSSSKLAAHTMPSRSMTAKLVRSTIENAWSANVWPIAQAAWRSSGSTFSTTAKPVRIFSSRMSPRHACVPAVEQQPGLHHHMIGCKQVTG